ncbi:MAG: DNA primase, partial [Clostridia bacterium]|nr:DNA primase [Clostridia bacterium]
MAISVDFQAFVDEVIEKNDIVDIVSQYTKLKRVGNRYQGLCPLHHDKNTPSFSVSADKQLFHCFGCGAGGTVIQFVMAKENLDYTDALNLLAERARVPIPDRRTPSERDAQLKLQEKKEKIYKMNSLAGKFFYDNLLNSKYKFALDYFRNRQLTDDTIRHFGLGYAPDSWTSLIDHLKSEGYTENEIFEAGLSVKRDNGTYFDKFRDRVMFPIIDLRGNVVAFGGRILTDKENSPKYLNSPDTPVYNKSQTLFAMNFAKNSSTNGILLMEGYMDVISLHQAGFTNAVASCGTAFTEQQARVIKKYTDKVILCYDSDEAGQKATYRAADILKTAEIKAKVLTITSGKDPDDFIKKEGKDRFQNLIDNSENITSYKIRKLRENYNLDNPDDKVEFVEKA